MPHIKLQVLKIIFSQQWVNRFLPSLEAAWKTDDFYQICQTLTVSPDSTESLHWKSLGSEVKILAVGISENIYKIRLLRMLEALANCCHLASKGNRKRIQEIQ